MEVSDAEAPRSGSHFALEVDDFDVVTARLDQAEIRWRAIPQTPGIGRQLLLKDPMGNLIEVIERTE
jgi:hypothetical protein